MTPDHIRIVQEVALYGVRDGWKPEHCDWPIVVELLESGVLVADPSWRGFLLPLSWPVELHSVHLSLEGRKRLEEWKEDAWKKTPRGRIWSVTSKFAFWIGALLGGIIGAAGGKVVEMLIERALKNPP